jgi:hypothetical protein
MLLLSKTLTAGAVLWRKRGEAVQYEIWYESLHRVPSSLQRWKGIKVMLFIYRDKHKIYRKTLTVIKRVLCCCHNFCPRLIFRPTSNVFDCCQILSKFDVCWQSLVRIPSIRFYVNRAVRLSQRYSRGLAAFEMWRHVIGCPGVTPQKNENLHGNPFGGPLVVTCRQTDRCYKANRCIWTNFPSENANVQNHFLLFQNSFPIFCSQTYKHTHA